MCQSKAQGGRRCGPKDISSTNKREINLGEFNVTSIIDQVKRNGGLTIDPRTGKEPTQGYVINAVGQCPKVAEDIFFSSGGQETIASFLKDHKVWFDAEDAYIGFWHDKENKVVVLDKVNVITDRETALCIAKERKQRALWDIERQEQVVIQQRKIE